MRTEPRVAREVNGFTLVEVLIAMVVLAVGLLGLEALGVGGVRAVAQAERISRSVAEGSQFMEEGIQRLRQAPPINPAPIDLVMPSGNRVTRSVCYLRDANVGSHIVANLLVTVTTNSGGTAVRPDTLRSSVFLPISPNGINASVTCP